MQYAADFCYLPAEWSPQDAILLTWPHPNSDWSELFPAIEIDYLALVEAISRYQALIITCQDQNHRQHIQNYLASLRIEQRKRIAIVIAASDDSWCRDFGPITVIDAGASKLLDFQFNAWGERFPWQRDNQVNQQLDRANLFQVPLLHRALILEGGSIESDGAGTLLSHSASLIDSRRNPGSREEIEALLHEALPLQRILWLENGCLVGDDTDSHIDNLVRFVAPGTLAYSECRDPADEQYALLQAMYEELTRLKQLDGSPYQLIALPLPKPCYSRFDNRRLPASYANFLITNNAVLVPQFDDPNDAIAVTRMQQCFGQREVIGIASRCFIEQNGGIHCLSMQLPAGTVNVNYNESE